MRRGTPRRLARIVTLALLAVLAVGGGLALAATNIISTVAGTGTAGYNGDGIPAASAQISIPTGIAATPDGGYLFSDQGNSRVRRVSPSGIVTTVAGNGIAGFSGDGGPATSAQLSAPNGVGVLPDGSILIADSNNNRVRRVALDGTITTVAGTGIGGYNGDGIAATAAQIAFPIGIAVRPDGGYLVGDNDNHRVRQVSPGGTITTVAGTGVPGFSGDGGAATAAALNDPRGVALQADGGFLISDVGNQRVRRVAPGGTITTVAGTGATGFAGDGGPATSASLNQPIDVRATPDGGFLIADSTNNRIRHVSPAGLIATVAGNGTAGFGGDGGLAAAAALNSPLGVASTAEGDYLIADSVNNRVRIDDAGDPPPQPPPPPAPTPPTPPLTSPALPTPDARKSVVLTETRGRVRVRLPGTKRYVDLSAVRELPLGTLVDATKGRVGLTSAANTRGGVQSAVFYDGIFKVGQSGPGARLLTVLALAGPNPSCKAPKRSRASRRAKSRRLWGDGKGRFQTKGQYSSATVRGTKWLVEDRCRGTLTKVARGSVTVRDLVRGKTVIVKAGDTYLAKARK